MKASLLTLSEIIKQDSGDSEPPSPSPLMESSNKRSFQSGQVYYASIAKQVHVYPNSQNTKYEAVIDNKLSEVKF